MGFQNVHNKFYVRRLGMKLKRKLRFTIAKVLPLITIAKFPE